MKVTPFKQSKRGIIWREKGSEVKAILEEMFDASFSVGNDECFLNTQLHNEFLVVTLDMGLDDLIQSDSDETYDINCTVEFRPCDFWFKERYNCKLEELEERLLASRENLRAKYDEVFRATTHLVSSPATFPKLTQASLYADVNRAVNNVFPELREMVTKDEARELLRKRDGAMLRDFGNGTYFVWLGEFTLALYYFQHPIFPPNWDKTKTDQLTYNEQLAWSIRFPGQTHAMGFPDFISTDSWAKQTLGRPVDTNNPGDLALLAWEAIALKIAEFLEFLDGGKS
jgi:hypothetical protein